MTKNYHHGNLRSALLDGAYAMLAEEGIQNLSLRQVARRIGVSHNAPYQHFPDREALIAALSEQGFGKLTEAIDHTLDQTRNGAVIDRILAVASAYVQFMSDHPAYLEVMFGPYPHQNYPELSQAALTSFERLVSLVEEGQATGEIKPINAREIAGTIWMTLHGVSTLFRPGKIPTDIVAQRESPQLAAAFVRIVCDGIRTVS
jgi:AcrR family transcriptional regulator